MQTTTVRPKIEEWPLLAPPKERTWKEMNAKEQSCMVLAFSNIRQVYGAGTDGKGGYCAVWTLDKYIKMGELDKIAASSTSGILRMNDRQRLSFREIALILSVIWKIH